MLVGLGAGARVAAGDDAAVAFSTMDTFEHEDERVKALRIPVYITLRSWEGPQLGLRLRLAASFSVADIFDLLDQTNLEDVSLLSFVPGMEFVVPIGGSSMLRPYLDAGLGTDGATKRISFTGDVGLRTEFLFPSGNNIFGLEPGFQLSHYDNPQIRSDTRFNSFIALTFRHTMGFRVGGFLPDAGLFFDAGYDFQTFEVSSVTADGEGDTNLELGIDLGFSRGRPKIGPFAVPRLRVGYRFGDVQGFRIRLGGDWLTTISDEKRAQQATSGP